MKYNTIINTQTSIIFICLLAIDGIFLGTDNEMFIWSLMVTLNYVSWDVLGVIFSLLRKRGIFLQNRLLTTQLVVSNLILLTFAILYWGTDIMWGAFLLMLLPGIIWIFIKCTSNFKSGLH